MEARRTWDAAATPKERLGIARQRSRRRRSPGSHGVRTPAGGSPTALRGTVDTMPTTEGGSRRSRGDSSLPSTMTGKFQVGSGPLETEGCSAATEHGPLTSSPGVVTSSTVIPGRESGVNAA